MGPRLARVGRMLEVVGPALVAGRERLVGNSMGWLVLGVGIGGGRVVDRIGWDIRELWRRRPACCMMGRASFGIEGFFEFGDL